MTSTISEMKCGNDTITLTHESGDSYTVTHQFCEPDLPESRFVVHGERHARLEEAAVAFTQRVVSLMTVYAEAPSAEAERRFIEKVCQR